MLPKKCIEKKYYLNKSVTERIISGDKKVYGAKILDFDKPCNTVLAGYGKSGGYTSLIKYSDNQIRKLTILELKRIQTFPDDYILDGTDNEIMKQIGNAVPCNLAFHIGNHMINLLKNT